MKRRGWLDFLADLFSGRVHNTLAQLKDIVAHHPGPLHAQPRWRDYLRQWENTIMQNQERLLNEALGQMRNEIEGVASRYESTIAAMQRKIVAGATQVDLTDEIAEVQRITESLRLLGQTGTANPEGTGILSGDRTQSPPVAATGSTDTPLSGDTSGINTDSNVVNQGQGASERVTRTSADEVAAQANSVQDVSGGEGGGTQREGTGIIFGDRTRPAHQSEGTETSGENAPTTGTERGGENMPTTGTETGAQL